MGKIITANFSTGEKSVWATGLDQYDYGAVLRIQGLNLPPAVEIHFCLKETGGTAPRRVGITKDGVTDVVIPDSMLENGDITHDYNIYAWVYLTDEASGSTERRITMKVRSRSKPEAFDRPEDAELFREAIAAVNEASERAEDAEKSAEAWVHGHEDYPERDEDNAKYYAEQAMRASSEVSDDAKKKIDEYVKQKEQELKGEPGTPGKDGLPGKDGITPHIGENNHWWIGDVDTGVDARGEKGNDGDTPHIGENGHWCIGDTDTGVTAKGADGYTPQKGVDYFDGADGEPGHPGKSAYQYAQDSGYTGTEAEFAAKLAIEYLTQETDPTVPSWAKQPQKPSYTAAEVGADTTGTAESKMSEHNVAIDAHNDLRLLIDGLTSRLNALADGDDETLDQMSEVVAYIKSNKNLIDAITTSKINVSDIIDNLTTNVSNKPLSAAQGVALKALIDAIAVPTKLSELENDSGYAKTTDIPEKLPNPQKLTFAGAVTGSYDGSEPVTVNIPAGGSGGTSTAGEDGGYYTPSVDAAGNLSWTASKTGMPAISGANIKGPKGDAGASGATPQRGVDYWTDADKTEIKSYVDEAILGGAW